MTETLPLFPLESVLYPGVVLPLRIFEPRYQQLVQELLALPEEEPRRFGVIAIKDGHEVGRDSVRALFDVGCVAAINTVTPHDNGRFDIVTTGVQRFRVTSVDASGPFLRGVVDFFDEPSDEDADFLAPRALALFTEYQDALARTSGVPPVTLPDLPTDPTVVSYLVAAAMLLDVGEKQRLLTIPDTSARLRVEASLLRRETGLLTRLHALPAVDLLRRRSRRGGGT